MYGYLYPGCKPLHPHPLPTPSLPAGYKSPYIKLMHLSMLSRGGRGGDFDILSKSFVKNHSPGTTYFVKKRKNPHPTTGELCQMFLHRGNAIHSRHPPGPNHADKKLYVAKPTKNRNHSSNQLHEIKIVINTKTQLMREQEANILLLLNSIKYNMLSFHSSDVGQTARPRERDKSNISILGRIHKVKSHSLEHECLIKIPTPAHPPSPRDNIDRCYYILYMS